MSKNSTTLLIMIIVFLSLYVNIYGDNHRETVNSNTENIVRIESLMPKRGERNIISTPEIKIFYNSNYNLNNYRLYLNYKDITNKTITTSKYIYYNRDKKLKKGVQVVRLEISSDNKNTQVTEWYFTVGSPLYNHYRGIFFNNTRDLNILTSHEDLNKMCKNTKHLDYLFITEKINNNINKKSADTLIDSKKWGKLIESCNRYCNNDDFISIPSFELNTKLKNETNTTKINIFNCSKPFIFEDNTSLESFYEKLFFFEDDLIGQFKYDNTLTNINYFKYSPYGDEIISLIELKKDTYNNDLNLDSYKEALDNGWHLSPITCEYNQYPNLNNNNFITTILCENLSKSEILDSIKNRRIYISENSNIDISYTLNKMPMGSIIKNPSYVRIIVSAIDNNEKDKIKNIQIFSNNNKIIYSKEFDSNFAKIDFTLSPPIKNTYYFAVITEENNRKSVTSPIWIED